MIIMSACNCEDITQSYIPEGIKSIYPKRSDYGNDADYNGAIENFYRIFIKSTAAEWRSYYSKYYTAQYEFPKIFDKNTTPVGCSFSNDIFLKASDSINSTTSVSRLNELMGWAWERAFILGVIGYANNPLVNSDTQKFDRLINGEGWDGVSNNFNDGTFSLGKDEWGCRSGSDCTCRTEGAGCELDPEPGLDSDWHDALPSLILPDPPRPGALPTPRPPINYCSPECR